MYSLPGSGDGMKNKKRKWKSISILPDELDMVGVVIRRYLLPFFCAPVQNLFLQFFSQFHFHPGYPRHNHCYSAHCIHNILWIALQVWRNNCTYGPVMIISTVTYPESWYQDEWRSGIYPSALLKVKVPDCHCDDNRVIPSKHKIDGETAIKPHVKLKWPKFPRFSFTAQEKLWIMNKESPYLWQADISTRSIRVILNLWVRWV